MKKMFLVLLTAFINYSLAAQKVTIEGYEDNDEKGYLVFLEKDPEVVGDFLNDYFKQYGKVRSRDNIYTITELNHPDFPFPELTVFSKLKEVNAISKTSVWLADSIMRQDVYSDKLDDLWYAFAVAFYKNLKQQEIDESLRALRFADKQFQRLEKDSLGLQNDIKKNIAEKAKLEEELKTNELNYKVLVQKVKDNKAEKDSMLVTLDKIKRLIEIQEREKNAIQ